MDSSFNANLPFTLADHIKFALERMENGLQISVPLSYDVRYLYPLHYELGQLGLDIIEDYSSIRLPDSEIVNIALHLVTAQAESGKLQEVIQSVEVISAIRKLIESYFSNLITEDSYQYTRFVIHLQFLIKRLSEGGGDSKESSMLQIMKVEYPRQYECVLRISQFFEEEYGWRCDEEEKLYLLIYLSRLTKK